MASKEERSSAKGFAGLSSMVSDVDATVARTLRQVGEIIARQQLAQTSLPVHEEQPGPAPQTNEPPAQPSGSLTAKRFFGIVDVIFVIWDLRVLVIAAIIGAMWYEPNNNPPLKSTYPPGSSFTSEAPIATSQPPSIQPPSPNRPIEDKPPIGRNNVLTSAQIKYCLAEKTRLDAAETVINNKYVDSDLGRFNKYVRDYNSRCGGSSYQADTLENAQRDVEPYRNQLQAEGRSRFIHSPSAATKPSTSVQVPHSARPEPDATIQAIQQRLNELGYDAGTADGLFGPKTRSAIQAFQRDNSITADGLANMPLLRKLNI